MNMKSEDKAFDNTLFVKSNIDENNKYNNNVAFVKN